MNTYIIGIPAASGYMEKTVQADYFQYDPDYTSMQFYIKPDEEDDDQDDQVIASFSWSAGMYIFKKDSDGRTNSASA